ncbi:hypothetical protein F8A88_02685 [Pseudodesulfovibrio senegalensis]|uniref:Uncharacterized protein n=1 Tax=Pseudodesulfovibrio senegalensis TaxID=1721087 RepID=A0A6N6N6U9_9BACT|nr:hypothetical protein F8A88_02685 [Pseudodesulfovibrio senegalensis]
MRVFLPVCFRAKQGVEKKGGNPFGSPPGGGNGRLSADCDCRKGDSENSALPMFAGNFHNAAHGVDDGMTDGKPQSGAFARRLGGKKRIEYFFYVFGTNAIAIVLNKYAHPPVFQRVCGNLELPALVVVPFFDCLYGVVHQVEHDLLELACVEAYRGCVSGDGTAELDTGNRCLAFDHFA